MAWGFHNPVRVTFGEGSFETVATALGGRGYVLVTYGEGPFPALAARIAESAGEPLAVIDQITPNPDFQTLGRCCALLADLPAPPQAIVALGGGSVIDTAKVLAASPRDFEPVRRFLVEGVGEEALGAVPIIALPTTAGTGSEVTCWSTVWDKAVGRKYSLSRPGLYPEQALVDPRLTWAMPRDLTVNTALDALSHALEAIWNRNANPVSTNFAVAAAGEILETLPRLAADLSSPTLRSAMARAALLAGLAFSNTRTALAHSLSYPITLRHGVPHGLACSFSLPMVLRSVIGADPDCDAALMRIFGPDLEAGAASLASFMGDLGVSSDAAHYGVAPEDFRDLVSEALTGERGRNFIGERAAVLNLVP